MSLRTLGMVDLVPLECKSDLLSTRRVKMNKQLFVKAVNFMKKLSNQSDEFNLFLKNAWMGGPAFPHSDTFSMIQELLSSDFHNPSRAMQWLDYFCWNLEFGKNWAPNSVSEVETGKDIPLQTPEQLYDFILNGDA